VPNVNNDQDVFNAHFLEEGEKFLTAAFLLSIIETLSYKRVRFLARVLIH
jgi:hypothetical protein